MVYKPVIDTVGIVFGGLDTVLIAAGVSSLLPFMSMVQQPTESNLQNALDVTQRALHGNFLAPLLSLGAFVRPPISFSSPPVIHNILCRSHYWNAPRAPLRSSSSPP